MVGTDKAKTKGELAKSDDAFIRVRGASQNNLQSIDLDVPRQSLIAFTGVSGSGKSSLAFGTIFAEAQRRYFDSIAPYARRLLSQMPTPQVESITGLPPAVALQQKRGEPTARSSVGTLTTLSNSLRMLYSRAGAYPPDAEERLESDAFSANTHAGACAECHGMGVIHTVTEESMVPDPTLTIKEGAIAAWPGAWQGKNYRDILNVLGYDVNKPWRELSKKDREWILFTEEKPVVTVHAEREAHRIQRPYQGTYMSAAVYVKHTFATTQSAPLRKRAAKHMQRALCSVCQGKRLKPQSLAVKVSGFDISELASMSFSELRRTLGLYLKNKEYDSTALILHGTQPEVGRDIASDIIQRIDVISKLGLDYLSLDRSTPTLSSGELQRLRITTQLRAGLFGVVYVLDEPSAGLHPADTEALIEVLEQLKEDGNTIFLVEHEMDIVKKADWIVDIGPSAGDKGGRLLYSGLPAGLVNVAESKTKQFLFPQSENGPARTSRKRLSSLVLNGVNKNNLNNLDVQFPVGCLTVVTGVSGSGKSTLVSQVLVESVTSYLGEGKTDESTESEQTDEVPGLIDNPAMDDRDVGTGVKSSFPEVTAMSGFDAVKRLVFVDQKPIGRTPRSNLATYTGLFDHIRKAFAQTAEAKSKKFSASRFSFNVDGGRCKVCDGEGFVSVELLFLPSVYSPCRACSGTRYNEETLTVRYKELNVAQVLGLTVDAAAEILTELPPVQRALQALKDVGLGYLKLGQPATELSGGEAQRIKLATELQRVQTGTTLYVLDEPTTGLHPSDVQKLMSLLNTLVDAGNTVVLVEHDLDVSSQADWIIDLGPGGGENGGKIVVEGTVSDLLKNKHSKTGEYLRRHAN